MEHTTNPSWEVVADDEALAERAAAIVTGLVTHRPDALLCLPTGETPRKTYARLAGSRSLLSSVCLIQLDEWGGLPEGDAASCRSYLQHHVIEPWGLRPEQLQSFRCAPEDPPAECARMARWLDQNGPIDLCLLGLGVNGHLGLIEPAVVLQPRVHVAELADSSRHHTMLGGRDASALYGMTLGILDLQRAAQVLLLVSGAHKREVLRELRRGLISTQLPASLLQLHPRVTVLCDAAAWPG